MTARWSFPDGLRPIFLFSFALILTACGAGGNSNSGGGGTPPSSAAKEWTWISGANDDLPWDNSNPAYGIQGTPAAANVPGGRNSSAAWIDANGNLWLFGGEGLDVDENTSDLNDLWDFNPASAQWTWVGGSSTTGPYFDPLFLVYGQAGVYGELGVSSPTNVPGGRSKSVTWTDPSGNFWLFGGQGFDSTGAVGALNDLWEFSPTSKQWTWVSGSNIVGLGSSAQTGVYGTLGVAAPGNVPSGLVAAVGWTDNSGNLWLFGGSGYDGFCLLNNLWEFNINSTEWTWQGGNAGSPCAPYGVYGQQGVAAANNSPGGRSLAVSWTDPNGNFWLFGGEGSNANQTQVNLNDLWEFSPTTRQWTWVSGSSTLRPNSSGQPGVYGTLGGAAPGNIPGGRCGPDGWVDSSGNLWLFGGAGYDSIGVVPGWLNDLWEFSPASKQWTWVGGNDTLGPYLYGQSGVYGTKGVPAASNIPGGRHNSATWIDRSGHFWLFAGTGLDQGGNGGDTDLNDLWRYQP